MPPRPTTITGACASTDRRRTKAVRDPPRAIDTASSAIAQQPRAIDLKLGPLRRASGADLDLTRPHPDLTSAGQGFDRSAIVPAYYACTTSFTSPPTAALPSVRDGADPWRTLRLHFGRRDAIWLVRKHTCLLLVLLVLELVLATTPAQNLCPERPSSEPPSAAPPAANVLPILRVIMDTFMHDLWHWGGRPTLQVPM